MDDETIFNLIFYGGIAYFIWIYLPNAEKKDEEKKQKMSTMTDEEKVNYEEDEEKKSISNKIFNKEEKEFIGNLWHGICGILLILFILYICFFVVKSCLMIIPVPSRYG